MWTIAPRALSALRPRCVSCARVSSSTRCRCVRVLACVHACMRAAVRCCASGCIHALIAPAQVIPGGPADLSGAVHEGSLITAIGGAKVTSHFHSDEISEMIRGEEGTRLSIEVVPPDPSGRHNRAKIQFVDLVLGPRTLFSCCRACIVRAAFRTCALPYHLFSPARLSEQVRMRVVDGGALARYRDAVSRQVNQQGHNNGDTHVQQGHTNGDTHVHTSYSQRGAHPAASPARQSMGASKMPSPAYFSSTPQPGLTDSMWGTPSTTSKSAANPWQNRGTALAQGPDKLSKLLESLRQFEAHLDREEHRFLDFHSPSNLFSLATALPPSLPYSLRLPLASLSLISLQRATAAVWAAFFLNPKTPSARATAPEQLLVAPGTLTQDSRRDLRTD